MIKILITQEGEPTLITPCLCCGSLKFVHQVLLQSLTSNHPCLQRLLVFISSLSSTPHPRHQECLQRWIKSSDIKRCELCKFPFVMQSKVNHHHHHHHHHHYHHHHHHHNHTCPRRRGGEVDRGEGGVRGETREGEDQQSHHLNLSMIMVIIIIRVRINRITIQTWFFVAVFIYIISSLLS